MIALAGVSGPAMALILALIIDLAFGELPNALHPVVWMGKATALLDRLAPKDGRALQVLYGAMDEIFDFSVNTNPYGPSPEMTSALAAAPVDRYPDVTGTSAREALGAALGVPPGAIALGAGAADLLWTIARVLIRPGDRVAVPEPTFCEFRAAAVSCGAQIAELRTEAANGFAIELGALMATRPRIVYLCAPNTPTGAAIAVDEISTVAARFPDVLIVLDQSFLSMSERWADAKVAVPDNVVRIRSLTKDHAVPGVRVGYVLAASTIVEAIEHTRPAWSTSTAAQAAVHVACRSDAFVREGREMWLADRRWLQGALAGIGLPTVPTTTGFFLVEVGDAVGVRRRLLEHVRILVRDATSFALPRHVRICARPRAQSERLVAALARVRDGA